MEEGNFHCDVSWLVSVITTDTLSHNVNYIFNKFSLISANSSKSKPLPNWFYFWSCINSCKGTQLRPASFTDLHLIWHDMAHNKLNEKSVFVILYYWSYCFIIYTGWKLFRMLVTFDRYHIQPFLKQESHSKICAGLTVASSNVVYINWYVSVTIFMIFSQNLMHQVVLSPHS